MRIGNDDILNGTPVSMSASFNLTPVYLGFIINYNIQLVFSGTPNGSFKLQCSNEPGRPSATQESERTSNITNWTDITGSSQSISAAGDHSWDGQNAGYLWVRVVYTRNSGTGSLTSARFCTKGV